MCGLLRWAGLLLLRLANALEAAAAGWRCQILGVKGVVTVVMPGAQAVTPTPTPSHPPTSKTEIVLAEWTYWSHDAVKGLCGLGMSKKQAQAAVDSAWKKHPDADVKFEEFFKTAVQEATQCQ